MQLPQDLQKFGEATLIISADSVIAKIYLAGGDSLEEISALEVPREDKQDNEASYVSPAGISVGTSADVDDAPRFKTFIKKVAQEIESLSRKHGIAHLDLVMPAETEHALVEELGNDVKPLVRRKLHKDLMNESPVELVKRLLEG